VQYEQQGLEVEQPFEVRPARAASPGFGSVVIKPAGHLAQHLHQLAALFGVDD
jgi:hypothetical protein